MALMQANRAVVDRMGFGSAIDLPQWNRLIGAIALRIGISLLPIRWKLPKNFIHRFLYGRGSRLRCFIGFQPVGADPSP